MEKRTRFNLLYLVFALLAARFRGPARREDRLLMTRGAQLQLQKETLAEAELAELRRGMALGKAA